MTIATPSAAREIAHNPDGPWMRNKHWATAVIHDSSHGSMIFFWVFSLIWMGFSTAATIAVLMQRVGRDKPQRFLILLFPLFGLLLLVGAINLTMRYLKFGRSNLELETLPGCVGGWLAGTVHTPASLHEAETVRVTLRCIRSETHGSGKDRRTHDSTIWEDEQTLACPLPPGREGGTTIPVSFRIPPDCQPTFDSTRDDIVWRLRVTAAVPGADYAADFAVPVFAAVQPDGFVPRAEEQAAPVRASRAAVVALDDPLIDISTNAAGRKRLLFPARRNHGLARGLTLAAGICLAIAAFISAAGAPFIFPLILGLIGVLLVYGAIIYWFRQVELLVDRQGIERHWRLLLFSGFSRLDAGEILDVYKRITAEAGGTPYYTIMVAGGGKEMRLVSNLRTSDATHVLEEIVNALGRHQDVDHAQRPEHEADDPVHCEEREADL